MAVRILNGRRLMVGLCLIALVAPLAESPKVTAAPKAAAPPDAKSAPTGKSDAQPKPSATPGLPAQAPKQAPAPGAAAPLPDGAFDSITTPSDDRKLGFAVGGIVTSAPVKPGTRVQAGQILLELKDDEGKTLIQRTKLQAESEVEVKSAQEKLRLAQIEEKKVKYIYDGNAGAPFELDRAVAQAKVAALEVEAAERAHVDAGLLLDQYTKRHEQYVLRSPMTGVVEQVTVREGETVEERKPILRMVVTDPLWVDAMVATRQTLGLKLGSPAWVSHKDLIGHEKPIEGQVIHIASVADAASESRLVRVSVPNPENLPAGAHVTVSFVPPKTLASAQRKEAP